MTTFDGSQPETTAPRRCTIELSKEYLSFSAAHFTVFSAHNRENLHGHNFAVQSHASAIVDDNGLTFDYALLKSKIKSLCDELDEKLLLPANSSHLDIRQNSDGVEVIFSDERIQFLERDVLLLPVTNVTLEELSHWFITKLHADPEIRSLGLEEREVRVSSGPGQWGVSQWRQ